MINPKGTARVDRSAARDCNAAAFVPPALVVFAFVALERVAFLDLRGEADAAFRGELFLRGHMASMIVLFFAFMTQAARSLWHGYMTLGLWSSVTFFSYPATVKR
jgi:hypothetical protein